MIENIKVINIFEPEKEIELEAVIDTGATMLVLPQNVIDKLNLRKMREVKVRYANNKTEIKSIYGVVTVEICGRAGEFNVLAEPEGAQPLVGQIILEQLDLIVDPSTRKVIPNPRSPDMPMVEVLMATPHNSGSLTQIPFSNFFYQKLPKIAGKGVGKRLKYDRHIYEVIEKW
ncbi:MAG: hypothetical protein N2V76_09485 [Methanophagales archaeon]|nr:hypothetical protein [Methanophagales archaeon]